MNKIALLSFGALAVCTSLTTCTEVNFPENWAALHLAAVQGNKADVIRLLNDGLKVDARDEYDCTPLHYAAAEGKPDTMNALLEAGADLEAQNDRGNTPLHCACTSEDNTQAVTELLEAGANIETRNGDGLTPLAMAVIWGCVQTTQQLIEAGAKLDVQNEIGQTPLDLAKEQKKAGAIQALQAAEAKR